MLKTLETKIGRDKVLEILHENGISGRREYPRNAKVHHDFVEKLKATLSSI